jgi:hypothetical protein
VALRHGGYVLVELGLFDPEDRIARGDCDQADHR